MPVVQAVNAPNAESFWAGVQEIREMQKENAQQLQETRRSIQELRESQKETTQQIKETERVLKENAIETNRRIGHLDNLFGEVAEYMIAPKLCEKFLYIGINFPRANRNVTVNDKINKIYLEIDIILENGDKALFVEVKNKLTKERINSHIERLEKMRKYTNIHGNNRTFLGAVAGIVITEEVRDYALNQGLYLIEPCCPTDSLGESFNITPPNGKPKEW